MTAAANGTTPSRCAAGGPNTSLRVTGGNSSHNASTSQTHKRGSNCQKSKRASVTAQIVEPNSTRANNKSAERLRMASSTPVSAMAIPVIT